MFSDFLRVAVGLGLVALSIGCEVPTFSNPLVDPTQARPPEELLGSFLLVHDRPSVDPDEPFSTTLPDDRMDPSMEYQHIGMAGEGFPKGFVRIVRVDVPHDANNRIEHSSIFGFTARIGESYILHIPVPKELPIENSTYEGNWDPERFDHYLLAFLKPTDAGIELRLLNSDFLIDEIKSGRLEGKHAPAAKPNDGETVSAPELTVTASSEALRAFFEQHFEGDLLLEPRTTYRRIE